MFNNFVYYIKKFFNIEESSFSSLHPLNAPSFLLSLLSIVAIVTPLLSLLSRRLSPPLIRVYNSSFGLGKRKGRKGRSTGLSTDLLSIGPIDFTRAILSDYFIYSAAQSGAASDTHVHGPHLDGAKGKNEERMGPPRGPLRGESRGKLCPHKWLPGSAVAHLPLIPTPRLTFASSFLCSSCLPLLLPHPSRSRLVFDPLTTDGTRVQRGYGAGGRACLFIFRYFRSTTRRDTPYVRTILKWTRLVNIRRVSRWRENGRVQRWRERLIVMDCPENECFSNKEESDSPNRSKISSSAFSCDSDYFL